MKRLIFRWLPLAGGVALAFACASKPLTKVESLDDALPLDLDREIQDKFEVKDASALPPSAALDPVPPPLPSSPPEPPVPKEKGKKKGKGAQAVVAQPAAPAPPPSKPPGGGLAWPNRRPPREPIWVGEHHVFNISYFKVSAGDFVMDVLPFKVINNRKVYHVRGTAVSSKVFSAFYRVNDMIETFIDWQGIFSHRFHIVLDEKVQSRDALELYDAEKAQTFYWNRWNHWDKGYIETKEFHPMIPFSQDSFSALFYLRTIPLPDGAVVTFPVMSEGKNWEAVVTVEQREVVDSPMGEVPAVKMKLETKFQGVLQKRGDSFLWLTDDERRFVLRLEAKVKIGTIVAELVKLDPGSPP